MTGSAFEKIAVVIAGMRYLEKLPARAG